MGDQQEPRGEMVAAAVEASHEATGRSLLTSSIGMLLIIPLLLVLTGGGILAISQTMMRASLDKAAAAHFSRLTVEAITRVQVSLGQADPLLDGLRTLMEAAPDLANHQQMAKQLHARVRGRPGLSFLSVSLADGTFLGVQRLANGTWSYQRCRPDANGSSPLSRWPLSQDSTLGEEQIDPGHRYDPRTRPFFRLAVVGGKRAWTEPYAFFVTGVTGISCVEPLPGRTPTDPPSAVISADFDLDSLDATLTKAVSDEHTAVLAFTADRTLVAAPPAWRAGRELPKDRLLRSSDIDAPVATGYFAHLPPLPVAARGNVSFSFRVGGQDQVGVLAACPLPAGGEWYIGLTTPRSALMGEADRSLRWSLVLGAGMLAIGGLAAAWFARHLDRSRSAVVDARQRARVAEARADEMGSYRLVKLLGKGGMGEVWRAEHRLLARPAAIKLITGDNFANDAKATVEAARRFEQEARITAGLRSRNTIEIYDFGVAADGRFFYAMELLDGLDLYDLVTKFGPLPLGRIVHLLRQACNSLAEAHARGLVHRDIKAQNLYVCRRVDEVDIVKVLDFGIARVLAPHADQRMTRRGFVQGTPATMSPEQAAGELLDGRSDLYSLGCVFHYLLTGQEVFTGSDAMATLIDHLQTPVPPLAERTKRRVPHGVEALMLRLLANTREARPLDAKSLAAELDALAIPPEETWDAQRAAAWWAEHLPRKESDDLPAPGEGARLVVGKRS